MRDVRIAVGGPLHGQQLESETFGPSVQFVQPNSEVLTYWRQRRQPDGARFFVADGLPAADVLRLMREVETAQRSAASLQQGDHVRLPDGTEAQI